MSKHTNKPVARDLTEAADALDAAGSRITGLEAMLADAQAEVERLREALHTLANAADIVGVVHFDSDDLPEEVETMQVATYRARLALKRTP